MAVKSIIDIQVNDGAFQRFNAVFQRYQQHLNATPLAWRNIAIAQGQSTSAFQDLVALEVQSLGHQKMMAQVQIAAARITRTTADVWRDMGRNTKTVAGNIRDATSQLLKWTSLSSVFAGVIGAGGLFGINRLAEGVAAGRRSSLGIGAGYGEQKAFKNSFDRIVDSDSFLTGVNDALHSATGKSSLFGAGLKAGDLNGSTSDVGVKVLERARALAKSSNPAFDVQTLQARGLDKFISLQDFQRLRSTSDQEFNDLKGRYGRNSGAFGVGGSDQLAYQNFVTTIDAAGDKLNAVFVRGLVPLIPGLEKLSTATVEVVKAFLEAPALKKWIDGAGQGLKTFADYVGTDEFQGKVKKFVDGLSALAEKLGGFVSLFAEPDKPSGAHISDVVAAGHRREASKFLSNVKSGGQSGIFGTIKSAVSPGSLSEDQLLALVGKKEGGTTGRANPFGAVGRYQIKPGTAREFGIDPSTLYTKEGNEAAARKILHTYAERFNGNLPEILAAYNQGSGAGNAFRRSGDNPASLKPEGRSYIQGSQGVRVDVHNAAGSSVVVTSSQLTAGGIPQ